MLFIGYPSEVKGYKLWNLEGGLPRTIVSRDVTFNENSFMKDDNIEDAKGKAKAVKIRQQDEIPVAFIDSHDDQAADQKSDDAGSTSLESDQQGDSAGSLSYESDPSLGRYNVARDRQKEN